MDFKDQVKQLSDRVAKMKDKILANMMALYRNIGLILFFTILITSGLFFSVPRNRFMEEPGKY